MPFKSEAQRRKFYELQKQGLIDIKTISKWESETPKDLPEKVATKIPKKFLKY